MNLYVEELGMTHSTLRQKITVGDNPIYLYAVRPHLYKHLNPSGSLTMSLEDASQVNIVTSTAVTIQSITDATGNYFHGKVRFYLNAILAPNTSYHFALTSTGGYSFSESAWIGWCNDFDLQIVDRDYTPSGNVDMPFLIELWEKKDVKKGITL